MANDRGGLIIIGLRDENDVALERTPVELVDGEEARLRQTVAGNLTPYVPFEIRVVESDSKADHGYYLISIPPSRLRPHAVRKGRDLRYPRRDGTTTRWLSEAEVADMYRDRFRLATDQTDRLATLMQEGLAAMDTSGQDAFLALALSPTTPGSMTIDLARVNQLGEWAKSFGPAFVWRGFFSDLPRAKVRARRVALGTIYDSDKLPNYIYAELHGDGAGFACHVLPDARRGWSPHQERPDTWIDNETLVFTVARELRLLGRHAAENAGCWGDCLVEARVIRLARRSTNHFRRQAP
jgi:hypothetical protein